jgi:hypothetical protein
MTERMLIGEVSEITGISVRMLRHYDKIGLVSPHERSHSGYRHYTDQDLVRLFHVEGLRSLGLQLGEIITVMDDPSFNVSRLIDELVAASQSRLEQEEKLLGWLMKIQASKPGNVSEVLHIIALIRGFAAVDPSQRQRIALSMTDVGKEEIGLLLEAALNEPDPNAAGALGWAVARSNDQTLTILAKALTTGSALQRRRAMEMLVKMDSLAARSVVAEAIENPDPHIRARAAIIRAFNGDLEMVPVLIKLIAHGRDDIAASEALAHLARPYFAQHGDAEGITTEIIKTMGNAGMGSQASQSRRRLTAALGMIPGQAAADALRLLAEDTDSGVAATAIFALQRR